MIRHLLRRLFHRCGIVAAVVIGLSAVSAQACNTGVAVQSFGFVQQPVFVQSFQPQAFFAQPSFAVVESPFVAVNGANVVVNGRRANVAVGGGARVTVRHGLFGGTKTVIRSR